MSELSFQKQAELWGKTYEILVKRGVLTHLAEQRLISLDDPHLKRWTQTQLMKVSGNLVRALDIIDERERSIVKAAFDHMALTAFGLGYTAIREYLRRHERDLARGKLKVAGLWCPMTLPGEDTGSPEAQEATLADFQSVFHISTSAASSFSGKGLPANADFLLWLSGSAKVDHVLVQEYSWDMPPELLDFRDQQAHLEEMVRHRRLVDSRGVFARVAAEVDGESFELSDDIQNHLQAFTSDNKPFYKICQASAYAESFVRLMRGCGLQDKAVIARALALTPNGLESLAAHFTTESATEPRADLMVQLGNAYRASKKLADGDEAELTRKVKAVFNSMRRKLPLELQRRAKELTRQPEPGSDYTFEFDETLPAFANPTDRFSIDGALAMVDENEALTEFFGGNPHEALRPDITSRANEDGISLRDLHAAAIVAGMRRSVAGQVNVLALEGNPGIGKTTAVRTHLAEKSDGYLFLYVSPRVIINRDVSEGLARDEEGRQSGILTLTSNAQLNASARRFHEKRVEEGLAKPRTIDGAVVADGVANLRKPESGSILVLTPDDETQIDSSLAGSTISKAMLSEFEDQVVDTRRTGVLAGLAHMTRELLHLNPEVNRVVLTAALQGFREREGGKTTIDALSKLFENKADFDAGRAERRTFARQMPNIVVMVDELTGDGAGAPFVDAVAQWLTKEFIEPFEDESNPFTVTLIVSDASLCNEVVFARYLDAGHRTPDKVLVSRAEGNRPFRLAVGDLKIGRGKRRTFHVMTNSFPARELHIRYRIKLTNVRLEESKKRPGQMESPREAILREAEGLAQQTAVAEIRGALQAGAAQVIYFAQDKLFLSDLEKELSVQKDLGLNADKVAVLDSSVPGWKRKKLIEPERRDSIRVFLMTSSGARGVSFPRTDWIIAAVPRFNIEAALMEIAQLVYRGRGGYQDEHGNKVSGDTVPRHLVMLVEDFVVQEGALDERQWLRQSTDLMTLLVMLRSTIWTRITGDAGLPHPLALVPVGAVGVEELVSVMSQNVTKFVSEAEVFHRRCRNSEQIALVKAAAQNVIELFSRARLQARAEKDKDGRTCVKAADMENIRTRATTPVSPLLIDSEGPCIPDHVYFTGPVILENWGAFAKQEVFVFEGHQTQEQRLSAQLLGQLRAIDEERDFPSALRNPAMNLRKLLIRDSQSAAKEFNTLKDLRSPNTWVALPVGYAQFIHNEDTSDGQPFFVEDPEVWLGGLHRSLSSTMAAIPPIARYQSFPWAASVGHANPIKLDQVFDDRYFMASSELNLLNTLLLARADGGDDDT
ncbi:hypothetical protein [Azoarcus sp. KH32C]|uniref:hypothetical protein n=1 Tax=Azoarcus sp. KH32C TaxID=748247 RepID=UPI0002386805|nr:hypothetical protein [Azoarcus sp. KH32C]BAL23712.1 helicase-like protein [Azoarcus sp. KH32C]